MHPSKMDRAATLAAPPVAHESGSIQSDKVLLKQLIFEEFMGFSHTLASPLTRLPREYLSHTLASGVSAGAPAFLSAAGAGAAASGAGAACARESEAFAGGQQAASGASRAGSLTRAPQGYSVAPSSSWAWGHPRAPQHPWVRRPSSPQHVRGRQPRARGQPAIEQVLLVRGRAGLARRAMETQVRNGQENGHEGQTERTTAWAYTCARESSREERQR